jgi:hypothetical protein
VLTASRLDLTSESSLLFPMDSKSLISWRMERIMSVSIVDTIAISHSIWIGILKHVTMIYNAVPCTTEQHTVIELRKKRTTQSAETDQIQSLLDETPTPDASGRVIPNVCNCTINIPSFVLLGPDGVHYSDFYKEIY